MQLFLPILNAAQFSIYIDQRRRKKMEGRQSFFAQSARYDDYKSFPYASPEFVLNHMYLLFFNTEN